MSNLDINQCDDPHNDSLFHGTHKCKDNSVCLFKPHNGFKWGNYMCACKLGFGDHNSVSTAYEGSLLEREYWNHKNKKSVVYNSSFDCVKCLFDDCCNLNDSRVSALGSNSTTIRCTQRHNMLLRYSLLVAQTTFILTAIILAILIFHFRNDKVSFERNGPMSASVPPHPV